MNYRRIEDLARECYAMRDESGLGEHMIAEILVKAVNEALDDAAQMVEDLERTQIEEVGAPYFIRMMKFDGRV